MWQNMRSGRLGSNDEQCKAEHINIRPEDNDLGTPSATSQAVFGVKTLASVGCRTGCAM